ncbi:epimerase [Saccharomonospora sp. CUA-673]|uniref:NAD-dependent epimerase/dehydratase family protein n=1 Tax=Saccharomonospora sp. CUA-673 TaxID=1904969 RepID=UPI000961BCBF|nr:NAD-dependent epimerase/dehydratase family protein [Saccharomonospora sp. CUA-673]OLT39125.1 epimerase [Saccharomonospora sp. CUA-673]
MRLLVLGGTTGLSGRVAVEAVGRGHDVVCAARGRSGAVPDRARLIPVDRDEPGAVAVLVGERFDAVVDVATGALGWVRAVLDVLAGEGPDAPHWTFVSSVNVYADVATPGQGVDAPLVPAVDDPRHLAPEELTIETYGGTKVASEQAVRDRVGDGRALIVRPGIISGPGDVMDRFGYWAARFARGGRTVIPDAPDQPIQHVDVRDLAAWLVTAAETRTAGVFDAVGPVLRLGDVLSAMAATVGAGDLELVPMSEEALTGAGVQPWGGPASLPLWLPTGYTGLAAHDPEPAAAAGLAGRSLTDVALTALADERARGMDRTRKAGLTLDEERTLLDGGRLT